MRLKNQKDKRTVIFLLLIGAVRLCFWWNSPGYFLAWLPLIIAITFILYSIKHNQVHLPVFDFKFSNRIFEFLLGVFTGTSTHGVYIVHVVNHHKENDREEDWGSTRHFRHHNIEFINYLRYILSTPLSFFKEKRQWIRNKSHRSEASLSNHESWMILVTYFILMVLKPESTILYIIIPNILVQFVLVSFNYFQHRDCDPSSRYNHSRNFTGALLNLMTFNNGYHTAHHLFPAAHWSEYKEIHSRIKQHISSDLIEPNIFQYFFRRVTLRKLQATQRSDQEAMFPLKASHDRNV